MFIGAKMLMISTWASSVELSTFALIKEPACD
jgi:hypothetical protein